ncbi:MULTISPECIES: alpha/beta hydrolase [Streptomyces]|uniref:Alpha/beta hydrolase n=1 Tax=Streptomyces tsukubensis (strain DSM 42081 / NBRC 108919 / NRRL 18488 / 9993) TaxID=1114943 RepID=I2N2I8_STRT9|nr:MULTISPECIES: alpha/beta hydrolase [Streptomyces]AZK95345.1 alpha/beta hydrolase [Streptomyces tsukubensis]EIF91235.1 hydrolase [Streptomyces tsukubensis NRRL18488]MYS66330.1 alpha/beta fold hydrolase [Streptomyces sp. SID5473]QKM68606.1 alpha/beta hydrolase [Streptomyces tsukubensis NRRL18488]TAI43413.1 alpha/beta hydrolase [Streptomyces tsukubensis]
MQKRRVLAPALAVGVLAGLAPALGAAPAIAAPADAGTQQTAPDWKRCDPPLPASARCATLKLPLDYRKPGGPTVDVEISRRTAGDPDLRRGILLLNPGGPSGSGLGMPWDTEAPLPKAVTDRYDVIGFDPRGVGASTPLTCELPPEQRQPWLPYKPETFQRTVTEFRGVAEKCRAKYGDDILHFNTRNTARDMDAIRAALGERKTSFLGYSYGTYLGAVYAEMFPHRTDRMVLDSAVDPDLAWQKDTHLYATEGQRAFSRWTEWAAKNADRYGLGTTPAEVSRTFWKLVRQADRKPVLIGEHRYDGAQLRSALRPAFYSLKEASELVVSVRKAAAGETVPGFPGAGMAMDDNGHSSFTAITCGDAPWTRNVQGYRAAAERNAARYPLYGDHAFNVTPCTFWDKPVEKPTRVRNGVGALILQNEWDSQTPLIGAQGLRSHMKNARLVTVDEGEGHGVYQAKRSACADDLTTAYLVGGTLPAKDVTCAKDPAPAGGSAEPVHPAIAEAAPGTLR